MDIVNFREVKTEREDNYDIAFVEGSISRESEIPRLQKIRNQAKVLVALGACACIGGVNCLKNHLPMEEALRIVYGKDAKYYDTIPARPINAVVPVDYYVRGCPPITAEFSRWLRHCCWVRNRIYPTTLSASSARWQAMSVFLKGV